MEVDGEPWIFDLIEAVTQVPEDFERMNYNERLLELNFKEAAAAVVVFSVHRDGSLQRARRLVEHLRRYRMQTKLNHIPIVMVANRTAADREVAMHQRAVSFEQVQDLEAAGYDVVAECCAESADQSVLEKIFHDLARAVIRSDQIRQDGLKVVDKRRPWLKKIKSIIRG